MLSSTCRRKLTVVVSRRLSSLSRLEQSSGVLSSGLNSTKNRTISSCLQAGVARHNCALASSVSRTTPVTNLADYDETRTKNQMMLINRNFSSTAKKSDTDDTTKKNDEGSDNKAANESSKDKESFEDMLNRMESEGSVKEGEKSAESNSSGNDGNWNTNSIFRSVTQSLSTFGEEVASTWDDLLKSGERKDINKKIHAPEATVEGEAEYTGPVEIMVIDESEHLTAWERMQRRLTDAPIIQDVLARTEEIYEKSGAKNVKKKVDHITEDAKEAWETSQNPWVYRVSSVYETITAETPESIAVKELRVLDPEFTLDDWREDVVELILPQIMSWFLQGKINQLKPWLGESVFKRIAAEITARKTEGVQIDTHVLGIMNSEILACEVCVAQE